MAINKYISQNVRSEQSLYEDIVIESLQFYGQDVYYLPREIVHQDQIFADTIESKFTDAYRIEMYIENVEGFDGEGDLFTKFGVEIRDQATFIVARKRWKNLIGNFLSEKNFRPREGDIIFLPLSKSMFEITKVETESPFYQLNQLPTFRLRCELFEYSEERFETAIDAIDDIEDFASYKYALQMLTADETGAKISVDGIDLQGKITGVTITDPGKGYVSVPDVEINLPTFDVARFGRSSLNSRAARSRSENFKLEGNGSFELFFYPTDFPGSNTYQSIFKIGDGGPQTTSWGIDSEGQLIYSKKDNQGLQGPFKIGESFGDSSNAILNEWNHILVGNDSSQKFVYFNGVRMLLENIDSGYQTVKGSYELGLQTAGTTDNVTWDFYRGYVDEDYAKVGTVNEVLGSRFDGDSSRINLPTQEFDSSVNTAALDHLNGRQATLRAVIDSAQGTVSSIVIVDSGEFYNVIPAAVVDAPIGETSFIVGETVQQVNPDFTLSATVTSWDDETFILNVNNISSTDGLPHAFNNVLPVTGLTGGFSGIPTSTEEVLDTQETAANTVYDNFEKDFLDFSESNPFGDVQ